MERMGHHPPDTTGSGSPALVWSKLVAPAPRGGLIIRAELQSLLRARLQAKLCLVDAPAGFGKTTLLAQWQAAAGGGRAAWVSLDEADNDPTRFWVYLVEALRTVEPDLGAAALQALQRTSLDYERMVLASLLNDLSGIASPLVLILDDYHLITNPTCHQTLAVFLDHLPAGIHVVLATRVDPPLPLARLRARRELTELRVAELQFTGDEAAALLNTAMGLRLTAGDVERLTERTEGWAAGLYLAGLSLRGREDPGVFISSFHGDNRHVADYLAADVLARQPSEITTFLLRTSVLRRLSGVLCDAVLEAEGSSARLEELERSNLFLVPLDERREWYRYHQLFGELLRMELASREPALVAVLHGRAAAWHRAAGDVDEAIYHATAAGEVGEAGELIAAHWLAYWRGGRGATVARWLEGLPEEAILADPPVAFVAAWIGGFSGVSKQERERWLGVMEDPSWTGRLPAGIRSLAFGAALARAAALFDDVGRAALAARRAVELAGPQPSPFWWMAQAALGHALYLSGRSAEARSPLEAVVDGTSAAEQPYAVLTGLAVLSLLAGDEGDDGTAMALARRAAATADAQGLSGEPLCGIVHLALGRALAREGSHSEAREQLEWALQLNALDSMAVHRAHVLVLLATLDHGSRDLPEARALLRRAEELVEQLVDPGMLPDLLEHTRRMLSPQQGSELATALTERELVVLRLLATRLSTTEIGQELHVSVNTVRTQVRAVYRKLAVNGRTQAVTRARQLGLLPRASSPR